MPRDSRWIRGEGEKFPSPLAISDFIRKMEEGYEIALAVLIRVEPAGEQPEGERVKVLVDSITLINQDFPLQLLQENFELLAMALLEYPKQEGTNGQTNSS